MQINALVEQAKQESFFLEKIPIILRIDDVHIKNRITRGIVNFFNKHLRSFYFQNQ